MSSSYRAQPMAGRVAITHDMPHARVISELDLEQADVLLQQLQQAIRLAARNLTSPPRQPGAILQATLRLDGHDSPA
jgi:hypothetical protein